MSKPPPKGTRVAIYARTPGAVQSNQNDGASMALQDQITLCRLFAQGHGWEVISVHTDAAQSGTGRGVELKQMLKAAAQRLFGVVLVRDISRLGHNALLVHQIIDDLSAHGVSVGVVTDPPMVCADCEIQSTNPAKEA